MSNFIFISPTFPPNYYQFPKAWKALGGTTLCIGEDAWEALYPELRDATDEYYQVRNLQDYDEVYRAVAWFAHKHGKIDWLESNNEFWLEQDARLRTDFNITSGDKTADVLRYKLKSGMKAFYERAGVPVARYHLTTTLEEGRKFVKEVGYPVIVKPDNGVGANATWKISDDAGLEDFYRQELGTQYIMEEFIPGWIETYDGIADQDNNIIFESAMMFPETVMDIVNSKGECFYYIMRKIPADLREMGQKVIHSFNIKGRFFHTEYFRLTEDKPGLGKKGELVGLEVNMRPPGGYTPDMMNFANDVSVYDIYAKMCMDNTKEYKTDRPYYCVHCGRRDKYVYAHSAEEIYAKYGENIVMHDRMPELLSTAMGNEFYMARFKTLREVNQFGAFVYAKEGDSKK